MRAVAGVPAEPAPQRRYRYAAGVAAMLALALALRAPLLGGGQIDYDEGVYWQSLRALASGHPLFTSVYSSQPPAFMALLMPLYLALGPSIVAARATVLILALAGIVAVYRTSARLGDPRTGLLAAAILAADPLFLRQSVTLQADGPCVDGALIAVALAVEARRARRGGAWLAGAAGAVLAIALLTKLLALAVVPALAVALTAAPAADRRTALRLLGAAALGGVLATAALLLPFAGAWPEMWRQAVGFHLGARALPLGGIEGETRLRELPVLALGLAGFGVAARRAPPLAAVGAAWALSAAILLFVQRPMWSHHAVVLVAPMAMLGGGVGLRLESTAAAAAAAVLLLAASIAGALWVRTLQVPESAVQPTVTALRTATAPGDLVVTDDQYAAALADRSTPPELVDTSAVRIQSGDLTAAAVESAASRPDVGEVLMATGRLQSLPGFPEWAANHFPVHHDLGGGRILYTTPAARG